MKKLISYTLGMSLTIDLIKYQKDKVIEIFISNKIKKNEIYFKFIKDLENKNIKYSYNDKIFNEISLKENCYVIGKFHHFQNDLVSNKHFVIKGKVDEGDLGTIMRTMASFNFKDLVLIDNDLDIFNLKTVRSSMGGIFLINFEKFNSLDEYLKKYPKQQLYFFNQNGNNLFSSEKIESNNYSLIFGEENSNAFYINKKENYDFPLIVSIVLYNLQFL